MTLWNAAIAVEQKPLISGTMLPFTLRKHALKFVSLAPKDIPALTSKFRITMERIPLQKSKVEKEKRSERKFESIDNEEVAQQALHLFDDLFQNISQTPMDITWELKMESCIDLFVHYFKYMWLQSRISDAHAATKKFNEYVIKELINCKEVSRMLLDVCASMFDLLSSIIQFKAGHTARTKNSLFRTDLSQKLQSCSSKMSHVVTSHDSIYASNLLSGLATICSLCVDCLTKTAANCKPEMKSLLSNELFEVYKLQGQLSDHEKTMWLRKGTIGHMRALEKKRLEAVSLDAVISRCNRIDILVKKICHAEGKGSK